MRPRRHRPRRWYPLRGDRISGPLHAGRGGCCKGPRGALRYHHNGRAKAAKLGGACLQIPVCRSSSNSSLRDLDQMGEAQGTAAVLRRIVGPARAMGGSWGRS